MIHTICIYIIPLSYKCVDLRLHICDLLGNIGSTRVHCLDKGGAKENLIRRIVKINTADVDLGGIISILDRVCYCDDGFARAWSDKERGNKKNVFVEIILWDGANKSALEKRKTKEILYERGVAIYAMVH